MSAVNPFKFLLFFILFLFASLFFHSFPRKGRRFCLESCAGLGGKGGMWSYAPSPPPITPKIKREGSENKIHPNTLFFHSGESYCRFVVQNSRNTKSIQKLNFEAVLWIRNYSFQIQIQLWIFQDPDPDPTKGVPILLLKNFASKWNLSKQQGWAPRSFPFGTFRSLKRTFHSFPFFFKFLAIYETRKNVPFFSVLF